MAGWWLRSDVVQPDDMNTQHQRKRCPHCGAHLTQGATLCASCGRTVARQDDDRCAVCGAHLEAAQEQCPVCGAERRLVPTRHASTLMSVSAGLLLLAAIAVLGARLRPDSGAAATGDTLTSAVSQPAGALAARDVTVTPTEAAGALIPSLVTDDTPTSTPSSTATAEPTATPTATASPAPTTASYVVQKGDTLLGIALAHDVSLEELLAANGLDEKAVLSIGQALALPGGSPAAEAPEAAAAAPPAPTAAPATPVVYTVASGDTLMSIASAHGLDWQELAAANGLSQKSVLSIGQELTIPVTPTEAAPVATAEPTAAEAEAARTPLPTEAPTATPAVVTYTVAKGDTLGKIAVQYDVSVDEIAAANDISSTAMLSIGQALVIPGTTPEATIAPSPTVTETLSPTVTATRSRASAVSTGSQAPRLKYAAPELLSPTDGARFVGDQDAPLLSWVSVGILEEGEWYRLRVWATAGKSEPQVIWTQATSWRLDPALRPEGGAEYHWQVQVATRTDDGALDQPLSDLSAKRTLTWR